MQQALPLLVALPLAMAFITPLFAVLKRMRLCPPVALATTAAMAVVSTLLLRDRGTGVIWVGGWLPREATGIAIVADGMTRLMLVVVNVVSFVAVLFAISYMKRYTRLHLFYSPLLLMIAGMNGVLISGDLFNIYVFVEVAAIASYALVGYGVESEELEASFKYLVLSAVASGFILLAVGIIYNLTGTLNLAQIAEQARSAGGVLQKNNAYLLALALFLAGFGLKTAMVPFHAWLPDAHPSAPAPVSAMLSGILIKACGVYVLARLVFNVLGVNEAAAYVLIGMGILSMVVGVLLAVGQWDFKRLLAYHSISQMGYVVLALGVGAEQMLAGNQAVAALATFGGLFHLINHAAFKSLLFLCSGSVVYATGERDMHEVGGIRGKMPITSLCTRIGALSISGIPPFNGFFSKLIIILSVVWAGHWLLGGFTVLVSFVTLLSFTKVQRYLVEGELPARFSSIKESPAPMLIALCILSVFCLALGLLALEALGSAYQIRLPVAIVGPARDALQAGLDYAARVLGG